MSNTPPFEPSQKRSQRVKLSLVILQSWQNTAKPKENCVDTVQLQKRVGGNWPVLEIDSRSLLSLYSLNLPRGQAGYGSDRSLT
jgi:hypothetical protein